MRQVVTLHMLHYVIHYEKVYQLTIRVISDEVLHYSGDFLGCKGVVITGEP